MMLRRHEEVAGLGRMVRRLFGDVVAASAIFIVPVAGKGLAEDRVERFLHSTRQS
jgi:hypothetical protein